MIEYEKETILDSKVVTDGPTSKEAIQEEGLQMLDRESETNHRDRNLKYDSFQKLTFKMFMRETLTFSLNYFIDFSAMFVSFIMFNLTSDEKSQEIVGFIFTWSAFFFRFTEDFEEPIGIVCGPFYSKGDIFKYTAYKNRLIFFQFVLFGICLLLFAPFVRNFFVFINVETCNLDLYTYHSYCFFGFIQTTYTIINFVRGKATHIQDISF